jgi:uncharacterized protein (UPF0332 family)
MSFDWHDYWRFANECHTNASAMVSEDAALRAAISRAYYSVFCRARNLVAKRGQIFTSGLGVHWDVIMYFKNSSDVDEQKVGNNLDRLRRKRNQADYSDVFPGNLKKDAQFAISDSQKAHIIIATLS